MGACTLATPNAALAPNLILPRKGGELGSYKKIKPPHYHNAMSSTVGQPRRITAKTALADWFAERSWKAFKFQKDVWQAIAKGQSGLLHATTGSGKTYAVWLGILMHFMAVAQVNRAQAAPKSGVKRKPVGVPLTVLWITPMRALAADTQRALQIPLDALLAEGAFEVWTVGARSGDTSAAERTAQNTRLPRCWSPRLKACRCCCRVLMLLRRWAA